MTVKLPRRRAVLHLPVMPRKFGRGDKRNYLRAHAWVEAMRALAQHYRDAGSARSTTRRRHAS